MTIALAASPAFDASIPTSNGYEPITAPVLKAAMRNFSGVFP